MPQYKTSDAMNIMDENIRELVGKLVESRSPRSYLLLIYNIIYIVEEHLPRDMDIEYRIGLCVMILRDIPEVNMFARYHPYMVETMYMIIKRERVEADMCSIM